VGWSLYQLPLGKRQGTPWTCHQSINGQHKGDNQPFMLTREEAREPMHAWREHAKSTQKGPNRE